MDKNLIEFFDRFYVVKKMLNDSINSITKENKKLFELGKLKKYILNCNELKGIYFCYNKLPKPPISKKKIIELRETLNL